MAQRVRLYGKGELIDKRGRLKVHYHEPNDATYQKLMRVVERLALADHQSPLRHDGFIVVLSSAKMFAPELTDDSTKLLGGDLSMMCDIRKYRYEKHGETTQGWAIYPTNIERIYISV